MTQHNADEQWETKEYRDRIAELEAKIERLCEALEKAEYETQRYKDALDKNASFEQLWAEVSDERDRLREALTIISEHRRAPEWVKRIATLGLALAKEAGQ
jgi:TolA-binding protein